ncbi:MAG: type II toxin-antitoxin system MqsA family antitoxin [bacterium]|nr:type II toxin-antitoxin system MqsA family antitoxin [bacterium]
MKTKTIDSKGWNSEMIIAMRNKLKLNQSEFSKLLGVDVRSVNRWENGNFRPKGSAEAILSGIREKLDKDPDSSDKVVELIRSAVNMGGLAYLIFKLLDNITK